MVNIRYPEYPLSLTFSAGPLVFKVPFRLNLGSKHQGEGWLNICTPTTSFPTVSSQIFKTYKILKRSNINALFCCTLLFSFACFGLSFKTSGSLKLLILPWGVLFLVKIMMRQPCKQKFILDFNPALWEEWCDSPDVRQVFRIPLNRTFTIINLTTTTKKKKKKMSSRQGILWRFFVYQWWFSKF